MDERPIALKNGDPNENTYLCPNDLLLRRADLRHHQADGHLRIALSVKGSSYRKLLIPSERYEFVIPTLIVVQKWHTELRNVKVGDVVLIKDSYAIRGHWKLAEVTKAELRKDGSVRDNELRYKVKS